MNRSRAPAKPRFMLADVVPHQATMSLLDEVIDYDEEWLSAAVTITPRSLFAEAAGVPAWIGIEYMAQAVAAYGGVQRRLAGRAVQVGFLVGTRKYTCNVPRFPPGSRLLITVCREFQADNGLGSFQCRIRQAASGAPAIEADAGLNVFLPDNVEEFLAHDS